MAASLPAIALWPLIGDTGISPRGVSFIHNLWSLFEFMVGMLGILATFVPFLRIFRKATKRRSSGVALLLLLAFESAVTLTWMLYDDQQYMIDHATARLLFPTPFAATALLAVLAFFLLASVRSFLREDFGKGFQWWKYTMWMAYCCPGVIIPPELEQLAREVKD
jgi:hypothetical protein